MMKPIDLTLENISDGLRKKEFSSLELTQELLKRIETLNPILNAFLMLTPEMALQQATAADARRANGEDSFLLGVPGAIKDVILTEGVRTTAGSRMLEAYKPPYNATVVERLNAAGMVMLGKTNCDEFAMGASNEHSAFGPVKNPYDLERVPGGSSGGSAAAIAADLAVVAFGSDTGGSIRQPAAFCGIVGLKPSYGRVSRHGLIALCSSFDQIGPMTKTVKDAAMLLLVVAGKDPLDSTTTSAEVPDYIAACESSKDLSGLRIGVPEEYFVDGMDPHVEHAVRTSLKTFEALGATIQDVQLPHTKYAVPTYYIILPAEASTNLARYDGIRFGHQTDPTTVSRYEEVYLRSRAEGFGDEVKRRIMIGTHVLSSGYYDAYYKKAQRVRTKIRQDFDRVFETVDVLVTPTAPTVAFKIGENFSDPITMYLADIFTSSANLAGLAALSLPCGKTPDGLPIGLQIIGNAFAEDLVLRVGHQYEQATVWHQMRPPTL
jgi:aspartyl-tRNA(Asn)/glutamyl-tRNA(Gln) amidotransferase subunit A